jgi:acyl-CoA synthetase (NDP forming)
VNPLDAWSRGGETAGETMAECLAIMMQDPGAAVGAVVHDRAPDGLVYSSYIGYMKKARAVSGKPVALVAARQGTGCDRQVVESTHAGMPVLDGIPAFLRGVRALLDYRDWRGRPPMQPPETDPALVERWSPELDGGRSLDEAQSLALLIDFDLPASACRVVDSEATLIEAAATLRYPLALKTAEPGILHKTDRGGVHLGLADETALRSAYRELAARLGPRALLAPMAEAGLEMILGARRDPQYGPVVLIGFGGVYAEVLKDVAFALPPFDATCARRKIDMLRLRPLLDGQRGGPPYAIGAFCDMAARFSALVHALRETVEEIDVNPVIVGHERCTAVDALIVGRQQV